MGSRDDYHVEQDKTIASNTKRIEALEASLPVDLDSMTVKELRSHAKKKDIDLDDATVKADILAIIQGG